jgi:hypothetical protein
LENPFVGQANALEANVNAKELAASASAAAAAASELAAANTANVAAWVSGTTYAVGVNRYDTTDFLTYRRKTAGAGTTRPGLDPTNWQLLTGLGNVSLDGVQTLTNKTHGSGSTWDGNTISIVNGGTGGTTAATARTNLDVPTRAGGNAAGTWGINVTGNAATASRAELSSFGTNGLGSDNQLIVNLNGYEPAYLFSNATSWGAYSASGGAVWRHIRATGQNEFNGNATTANNSAQLGGQVPSYYQQALGFTPVQQSGGAYMGTNKVYVGWDGGIGDTRLQIDATQMGAIVTNRSAIDTSASGKLFAPGMAPLFACRAWVNFNGTGTVAIRASGNVSSITDNGTGNYTVNFTTAMPNAFSVVAAGKRADDDGYASNDVHVLARSDSNSTARIYGNYGGNAVDMMVVSVAVFC